MTINNTPFDPSTLQTFNKLYPMFVEKYVPSTIDPNISITDKMNAVIDAVNKYGAVSNTIVNQWNQVMYWCLNDGLTTNVNAKIDDMNAKGIFNTLVNVTLMGDLTKLTTTHKDNLVNAINDVNAVLPNKADKTQILTAQQTDPTTTGWVWQTSYNDTYFTDNAEKLLLDGKPTTTRKKLVVIGSSVCYGQNATNLMGWANKLIATLQSRGWTAVNHAIPGDTTQAVINRWFTDVLPERPDFVLIGLSLGNEGISAQGTTALKEATYNTYRDNMLRIVRMIKQMGAIPIIASTYPRNDFSSADYEYCKQINREIETWNVYQINLMGNVDDGTGHFISGTVGGDGLHPTDSGYDIMYQGIPTTIFENLTRHNNERHIKRDGYLSMGTGDTTTVYPLQANFADALQSAFTVFFKMRDLTGGNTKVFLGLGGAGSDARLRNTNTFLEYFSATAQSSILSTLNIKADTNSHDVALSWSKADNIVKLYIDGALVGSCVDALTSPLVVALAGGGTAIYNANGVDYKDLLVYRVRLNDRQIAELSSGHYLKAGLEIYAPLSDKNIAVGQRLINLAPTNSYMQVNSSAWISKTSLNAIGSGIVSSVQAQTNAIQNLVANTFTKVAYATKQKDALNEFDNVTNYRFTAQSSGTYFIRASIGWNTQTSGNRTIIAICKNGGGTFTETERLYDGTVGGAQNSESIGSTFMDLVAGDTIEIYAFSSNALATLTGQVSTLKITKLY